MTQNGLKWILNTTLKSMKFCRSDPPPGMKNFIIFFLNEGFPNHDFSKESTELVLSLSITSICCSYIDVVRADVDLSAIPVGALIDRHAALVPLQLVV